MGSHAAGRGGEIVTMAGYRRSGHAGGEGGAMKKWLIHAIFRCSVCGKTWEAYRTASRQAAQHARTSGHAVHGEVGYGVTYNERGT